MTKEEYIVQAQDIYQGLKGIYPKVYLTIRGLSNDVEIHKTTRTKEQGDNLNVNNLPRLINMAFKGVPDQVVMSYFNSPMGGNAINTHIWNRPNEIQLSGVEQEPEIVSIEQVTREIEQKYYIRDLEREIKQLKRDLEAERSQAKTLSGVNADNEDLKKKLADTQEELIKANSLKEKIAGIGATISPILLEKYLPKVLGSVLGSDASSMLGNTDEPPLEAVPDDTPEEKLLTDITTEIAEHANSVEDLILIQSHLRELIGQPNQINNQ